MKTVTIKIKLVFDKTFFAIQISDKNTRDLISARREEARGSARKQSHDV